MSSIILRDEHSTLQLSQATFDTGDDDVYLIAEASMKGFVGRNTSVGVSRRIWDAFIGDLKKLETTRTGEARLVSMSPADLELRAARVPFRIEIDPSTLDSLVTAFEQFEASRE